MKKWFVGLFNNFKKLFGSRAIYKLIDDNGKAELVKQESTDNIRRILFSSLILVVFEIFSLIKNNIDPDLSDTARTIYGIGGVFLLLLGLISIFITNYLLQQNIINYRFCRIYKNIFYIAFIIGGFLFVYGDFVYKDFSTDNIFLLCLTLAILPLFNVFETCIYFGSLIILFTGLLLYKSADFFDFQYAYVLFIMTTLTSFILRYYRLNMFTEAQKMISLNEELYKKATTDPLTKLKNRYGMEECMNQKLKNKNIQGVHNLAIMIVDIDFFKQYNDRFLHVQGDKVLVRIAEIIQQEISLRDIAARWGGEEFFILIDDYQTNDVLVLARKIKNAVEELKIPAGCKNANEFVTVSIGLATLTSENLNNYQWYIHVADQQLYHAKERGRNCIAYKDEIIK